MPRTYKGRVTPQLVTPATSTEMVNFPPHFLVLLASALLVATSSVPVKRVPDNPGLVAREPDYPLHLAKREAAGRKTRHLRPVYENTERDITPPDVGQVPVFPPTEIPEPIRGPYGDIRTGGTNKEIDKQNPDYVAPPLSDNGLVVLLIPLISAFSSRF